MGLSPAAYLNRAVDRTLSGGERKRIEIASILVMKPKLVLMDEPDSGIDVAALEHIFKALNILKEHGSTIIMITHSPTVLQQAEQAFLLCNGKLTNRGPVEKIDNFFESECMQCDHQNMPEQDKGVINE